MLVEVAFPEAEQLKSFKSYSKVLLCKVHNNVRYKRIGNEIRGTKLSGKMTVQPFYECENSTSHVVCTNQSLITDSYDNGTLDIINYCPYVKSPISNIILVVLYSAVCVVGVIGNSLVIFVVLKFK